MSRFEKNFAAVSQRMTGLSVPAGVARASLPIASIIDRLNAARDRYQQR